MPLLEGLQPDTEYFYRLQGTGIDGNLYQSQMYTFTTPVAAETDELGPNAALDATVVEVSSEFSEDFAGALAIDGNPTSEWSTDGDGDDASITIDLGASTDIVGVGYRTRSMSDGTAVVESYTVSVDGEEFGPFEVGQGLAVEELNAMGQEVTFAADTTTGGNTGAAEIEVYTAP